MKGMAVWAVLLLMAPALCAIPSSTAAESSGLFFSMVNPGSPGEFIVIKNDLDDDVSLQGIEVTDGEGTLTFGLVMIPCSSEMILAQNRTNIERMMPSSLIIDYSDATIAHNGRFTLANDGDQVVMRKGGAIIDMVCYGAVEPPEGWSGNPCIKPSPGHLLVRVDGCREMFSSSSWSDSSAGRISFPPFSCEAPVMPLIFPEAGHGSIVDLIDRSVSSISASIYTLDDGEIIKALLRARERSVNVSILLEGQPVGGMTTEQKGLASALVSAGCQVWSMTDSNSFRRYEFLHAKYGVFDSSIVLVTSENWGAGLHKNRGWGAIVRSEEMASRLLDVFSSDTDRRWGDLVSPGWEQVEPRDCDIGSHQEGRWYDAELTLLVSPDQSLTPIIEEMASSSRRIYLEEMSFDPNWGECAGLIDALLDAARRGIETKVLLDGTSSDLQNRFAVNSLLQPRIEGIEARLETAYHNFSMVHNKGMIIDDSVLVSSINLGHNALSENRETGVLIRSEAMADLYAKAFLTDWVPDPYPPHLVLMNTSIEQEGRTSMVLDASGSWDESGLVNITWDLNMDGEFEFAGPRAVVSPTEAVQIMVRVTDNYGNYVQEVINLPPVRSGISGAMDILPWLGLAPLSLLAVLFLRKRVK
ncbi:MAG: cardiolipin synthetase [Methanomassiliicoccales archaeon PtaU1.Bin124]|nr:MAG: cardiolipin synthetase [Methanomassiliicoccales archaeon PtaU1.Bin124]